MNLLEESEKEFDSSTVFGSASTFRYKANAYTGGSDHAEFVDSTIRVPCVMLLQWPDLFYHSSMDTIDKVSSASLKRVGWIGTIAALTIADADVDEAFYLANQTSSRAIARIKETGRNAIEELYRIKEDPKLKEEPAGLAKSLAKKVFCYRSKIEYVMQREKQAVISVKRLAFNTRFGNFSNKFTEDIYETGKKEIARINEVNSYIAKAMGISVPDRIEESEPEKKSRKIVPKRLFKGSLSQETFRKALTEKEYEWYEEKLKKEPAFRMKMVEALNFMDGKRTLYEIIRIVSAEYTETKAEDLLRFMGDLEKMKLVSVKRGGTSKH